MVKLLLKTVANALAIYFASNLIDGFTFSGNWFMLAGIGATLTIFQTLIYPILKIIAFPVALLSFGLFGPIASMAALGLIAYFLPQLTIDGIIPLLWATAIITATNVLVSWL